jgi:hypothetical protein
MSYALSIGHTRSFGVKEMVCINNHIALFLIQNFFLSSEEHGTEIETPWAEVAEEGGLGAVEQW